jgi:hypothetical protein
LPSCLKSGTVTDMKQSCFGMILTVIILITVLSSGIAIWHLSDTAEFSRKEVPAAK